MTGARKPGSRARFVASVVETGRRWGEVIRSNETGTGSSQAGLEIAGIVLAVFCAFLLVSLFTFNPADSPDPSRIPRNLTAANACGTAGAYISYYMFRYIGVLPSFALAVIVGVWGGLCITRRGLRDVRFKPLAVAVFVMAFGTLERMALPEGTFGGRLTGGYFGTFLGEVLTHYLGLVGAFLTAGALMGISGLLTTDLRYYDIFIQLKRLAGALARAVARPRVLARAATAAAAAARAALSSLPAWLRTGRSRPAAGREVLKEKAAWKRKKRKKKLTVRKAPEVAAPPVEQVALEPAAGEEGYRLAPLEVLSEPDQAVEESPEAIRERAATIEKTLESFGVQANVVAVQNGPVITMYELALAAGVKAARIASLSEDMAMALRAPSVRTVYPIPGKSTIGIEVPNTRRAIVRLKEMLRGVDAARREQQIPLFLGKDAAGAPIVADLAEMPHLLIAGATGSGKSVCINSIIASVLYSRTPDEVKLILIDPKVVELSMFESLPHLLHPVVTDMGKAAGVLEWAMQKMDERYDTLQLLRVRNIKHYNGLSRQERERRLADLLQEEREALPQRLPYIVIVIDELADLMMAGSRAVESSITRLAQKSRAVGIHLVLATQRPSVDVITGLIKTNMPTRIAFHVSSKTDSRTILDRNGAEALLMQGDMLYLRPGASALVRAQGTYVDEEETKKIVEFLTAQARPVFNEELLKWQPESARRLVVDEGRPPQEIDELYNTAVEIILSTGRGSVSLLQRKLGIGYGRASRLVDIMEAHGVLGPAQGSKPREPLMTLAQWHEMLKRNHQ